MAVLALAMAAAFAQGTAATMPTGQAAQGTMGTTPSPGLFVGGAPTGPWWTDWRVIGTVIVILLATILWVLHRVTRSRYLNPGVTSGVALLIVVYLLTSYVVGRYKRPEQTTIIEAQAMDMSLMRAPVGTAPVATEVVKAREFAPAVTYTGTVVAENDEDVFPRVTGTIVSLPVYPGDRVTPGQLLVKLDDVELSAREREAAWDREAAVRARTSSEREEEVAGAARAQADAEVGQAEEEARVAQREVKTAESELKQGEREVERAEHSVEAARQEVEAGRAAQEQAQAEAAEAAAGIEAAQAEVESAKANLAYWEQEIKRAKQLLDTGAYSTDEYQNEQAQYEAAKADVSRAQSGVAEKKQALAAAQAAVKQAGAAVAGAQARVSAAQSEVEKARAGVEKAEAAVATAEARVDSAQAAVRSAKAARDEKSAAVKATQARTAEASASIPQRQAALTAARTVKGYTEIRARRPGRVIQRLVSPGVLVEPGTPILRLAQIDRVRLQAYVSQRDLQYVAVGGRVEARSAKLPGGALVARVTSVFPAADPTTRTSVVEALVVNPRGALYPGDALTLTFYGEERYGALAVPNAALVSRAVATGGPSSKQEATVWLAQAGSGGATKATGGKQAHQVVVTIGATDGQRTEVKTGLKEGDEVIYRGTESLREGDPVSPVPWTEQGPTRLPPAPVIGQGATSQGTQATQATHPAM